MPTIEITFNQTSAPDSNAIFSEVLKKIWDASFSSEFFEQDKAFFVTAEGTEYSATTTQPIVVTLYNVEQINESDKNIMDRELKKIASELNLELGSINSTVSSQSPASLFGIAQDKQKEDGQVDNVSYVPPITAL